MDFNPLMPGFHEDPYPIYREMRAQGAVHRSEAFGVYVACRYAEVQEMLKHHGVFTSTGGVSFPIHGEPTLSVINADPPEHPRLRGLVSTAFTPRIVADLEPRVREITAGLLGTAIASGEADIMAALAVPLPVMIIAELMGIETDRLDDFKRWSTATVATDDTSTVEEKAINSRLYEELVAYFDDAIARKRASGGGSDLISALIRAETEDNALTSQEVIAFCVLLLVAGNETTTNLIGNALLALMEHPDQLQVLRDDPSRIPGAVEEVLRYDSPVQFLPRATTRDTTLGGVDIPQSAQVFPIFGSANRDERRYQDSDRFDITRNAQGHVAFGHGIHFCLGAPLARLEARVALEMLLAKTSRFSRADDDAIDYGTSMFMRGPRRLQLRFAAAG